MSRAAEDIHAEVMTLTPPGWAWPKDGLFAALFEPAADLLADVEARAEVALAEIDPRTAVSTLGDYERVLGAAPCGQDVAAMTVSERQLSAHARWTARGGQHRQYYVDMAVRLGYSVEHDANVPAPVLDAPTGVVVTPGPAPVVAGWAAPGAEVILDIDEPPAEAVTIQEFRPFVCGLSRCGEATWRFGPAVDRYTWIVHMPGPRLSWFRMGASRCGMDPILSSPGATATWFRCGWSSCGVDPHVDFPRAEDLECMVRRAQPEHGEVLFRYAAFFD